VDQLRPSNIRYKYRNLEGEDFVISIW
jgi:hypothetical protein